MPPPLPRPAPRLLLNRILHPITPTTSTSSISHRNLTTPTPNSSVSNPKLERIADELLSLNKLERYDYSILFRLRLGLSNSAPSLAGLDPGQQAGAGAGKAAAPKEEKTAFDVKLEKYDAAAKIKVIKEVRGFTELGLKEAKDMVEKAPIVVKKGVTKEEGDAIIEKMKVLGATVVLE